MLAGALYRDDQSFRRGTVIMARTLDRRPTIRTIVATKPRSKSRLDAPDGLTSSETRACELVVGRLQFSYPELAEAEVREIVYEEVRLLEGARLRQFVPLLVERAARDVCRRRARASA